jgi:thiamine-phosphate pyrophosphorylase
MTPLALPALMLVASRASLRPGGPTLARVVSEAVDGGVTIVQLREPEASAAERLALARDLRASMSPRALLLVNGDMRAAIESGAGGIHLPEAAPPLQTLPEGMLLSRAAHSVRAARRAEDEGAGLVVFGSVFASATHPGAPPAGLDALRAVCAAVHVPVLAIGGVDATNTAAVIGAGAAGVAVVRAIFDAPDPRAAASALRAAVDAACASAAAAR